MVVGKKLDLKGQRFGRLVAIRDTGERKIGQGVFWECKCDCGEISVVSRLNLRNGHAKSCGCLNKEVAYKKMKTKGYHAKTVEAKKGNVLVEGTDLSLLTKRKPSSNTSGHKGVHWDTRNKKWKSQITLKGKKIYLGHHVNKQDAINARLEAEEKYFKPILEKYKKEGAEELEG